jgi:NAD(P)-dependent dehydrogenase (short-subunit alcohol dehydrogenase family)
MDAMMGKTILITGADGGIGREITRALAKQGATLVMACIDVNDARPVCEAIAEESGNRAIEMMQLDLASLASIRQFATSFSERYPQLHVLINNAGVYCAKRQETADGFEKAIGINYLGPFLLTHLLLPVLKKTPQSRIINVSSNAYAQGRLDLNDLHLNKRYQGFKAYANSKLAVVLFTLELAERLKDSGITVNAVHPGHVATNIWNMWPGTWYQALLFRIIRMFARSPEDAAQNSVFLTTADEVKGVTGTYFDDRKPKALAPACNDVTLRRNLWELSEKLTGLDKPDVQ